MLVDDLRNRELGNAMEDSDEAIVKWVKHRVLARKFEKKMWQSHHSNVVHELIHQPTTTNLFITVDQETNKLIVRNGVPPEPSFGIVDVTYFIKAQGLILSHENLDETLIYGTIVIKQTAASVLEIMEQTLYPNIFDSREWNQSSKLELQGLYHRFMASLTESANEESSSTALYFPSKSNKYFDKESTTYDKDVVQQLEAVSIHWIRQVKDVLNSHEHNITLDHQGPMEELRFWESRSEDLVGISQQLHCPQVLDILSILKEAKSKYAKPVEALSGALRQGSEEAANSVKFLRLLQGPCKLLAKLEAAEIPSLMLKFLNCIRLIHVHSANYNTNEKVSDLIRRVSSEIIRQCTFHISLQEIFYGNLKKSMTTLNDCIKCGKAWKKCYNRMTITVNRQKNENGNSEEHWKLNDPSIFAEMDAFVQRCDDLIDICNSRVQFVERLDGTFDNSDKMYVPTFGWTNGPEIENSVRVVQEAFLVQINRLNRLEYSILNARESRWHGDYNAFKMASKDLDTMLVNIIHGALKQVQVIDAAMHLLQIFDRIAHRPAINACMEKEATELRGLYLRQCQNFRHEFDNNHRKPPLRKNEPIGAGSALWANALCTNVENGWNSICSSPVEVRKYDGSVENIYSELIEALTMYQKQKYSDWLESLAGLDALELQERLDQPLLRKLKEGKNDILNPLASNFDIEVMSILIEAAFWDKLQNEDFATPNEILGICHQREILRIKQERVMMIVRAYNDLLHDLKGTSMLFLDDLKFLDKKLRPGFIKIMWSTRSVVIEKFVQVLLDFIYSIHRKVKKFHCGTCRIQDSCQKIASTLMIRIDHNLDYKALEFESIQSRERNKGRDVIFNCRDDIELEVNKICEQFKNGSKEVLFEWIVQLQRFDDMILASLMKAIRLSLKEFAVAVDTSDAIPLFSTYSYLKDGQIDCRPSLISITNSANNVAKQTVNVVKGLLTISKNQDKDLDTKRFYDAVASDEIVLNRIVIIMNRMSACAFNVSEKLVAYDKYSSLWSMDLKSYLRRYSKSTQPNYKHDIQKFISRRTLVEAEESLCKVNFVQLDFISLKTELCSYALNFKVGLVELLKETTDSKITRIYTFITESSKHLAQPLLTVDDLGDVIELLKQVEKRCEEIEDDFHPLFGSKEILEEYGTLGFQGHEGFPKLDGIKTAFSVFMGCITCTQERVSKARVTLKDTFQDTLSKHYTFQKKLCIEVEEALYKAETPNISEAAKILKELQNGMIEKDKKEQELQRGLDLFQQDLVELKNLTKAKARVELMASTVSLSEQWDAICNKWKETPLLSLNFNAMTDETKLCISSLLSMDRDIREWSFWTSIKRDIEIFQALSPLMVAAGNVDMRERHWQSIQELTGEEINHADELTLRKALSFGLDKYEQTIVDISESASKEFSIEKSIIEIEGSLVECRLTFILYKESSLKVMVPDDFFTMLEDHQVTISAIQASPAGKTFEHRVVHVRSLLKKATDLFEAVLLVQRQWIYLENIFAGEGDISEQLPLESEKFSHVNSHVMTTILHLQREQNVHAILICTDISIEKMHSILGQMEEIQSSLNQYLESKRRGFPRFYFVSDDDLLEMIGKASQPQLTQKYIQKCFEGIQVLKLEKNDGCAWSALGGESMDEEFIMFNNPVPISGSIEEWMQQILDEMKSTMMKLLENAFIDKKVLKPLEWVPKWQGQLLIASGSLAYTKRCERALFAIKSGRDKNALRVVKKKYTSFLRRLTEMVRSEDIDATNRCKVVALITTEIHNRDVIEKMLRFSCQDQSDFIWSSQLRFYLNEGFCEIHQSNYSLKFGYEYQGNNGRLVITPLTDRCVLTLLTALSLHRGGNPLGPAGTGKTETVKDLAKNLAFFCVVTNCGENLDYKSLGRIFSGLCQSGSWGCFDEFNRIKIEVISVAAVQIGSILNAQRNSLVTFSFLGVEIPRQEGTGIFITMNPGYAGRTELPDNLKALLRPVAMMAPDLALITEVILASEGFACGKSLAQRIIVIYRLMQQQLSKCSHYDFGLRNIKSVLTMAGSLKRQNSNEEEAMIIIRSLIGLNEPRFLCKDKVLFHLLLVDLFPEENLDLSSDELLSNSIDRVMRFNGLYPDKALVEKTVQLAHSQKARHSNMLIGETMTGKTTIWKSLSIAKTKLDSHHPNYATSVKTQVLNPKALSIAELYGSYDTATFEWSDGVLSTLFKGCAENELEGKKGSEQWIVFDGPVDALWIESMNSVMDDSKILTLINGDRVSMTNSMSLLFEVEDLQVASPATVSRAGMIFVDCAPKWRAVIQRWLDGAKVGVLTEGKDHILNLCEKYLDSVLSFKRVNCLEPVLLNDVAALTSFTQLYGVLLSSWHKMKRSISGDTKKILTEKLFIFCLAWTIGGALESNSRKLLDRHLRALESKLMPTRSIYEHYIDFEKDEFVPWSKMLDSVPTNTDIHCHAIMVPTINTVRHSFILSSFADNGHRILITGERGTGKTAICQSYLQKLPPQSDHTSIGLSRTTTSNFLRSFIGASLQKISKGIFGPRSGLQQLIIFLDDLNIPEKTSEESPSQPPLELMRQYIDYGGWYNTSTCSFEKIINTKILCAMAHPTGGREIISGRTQSRFSILNCSEYETKELVTVFSSLLRSKLSFLPDNIMGAIDNIADATVMVFKRIRKEYLPIPGKVHYKFDLRDFLRVAHGMCLINRETSDFQSKDDLYSLWQHECVRTFSDRFVDDSEKDMKRFLRIMDEVQRKHMEYTLDESVPAFSPISQVYQRCKDNDLFEKQVTKNLVDYNESGSFIPMSLVLFQDAVNHLSRIQRVLMLERGYMLFVGLGGSGRESLSRLAAFASGYEFYRIEASPKYKRKEFLEDLKDLSMRCGLDDKQVLFFLKDTDIQEEAFLEDISSLLDSGEVHGCFGKEDVLAVCDGVRKDAAEAGLHDSDNSTSLWMFFIERVRKNLKIIMAFSSIGHTFPSRIESFPALMNCAVVNWFNSWPTSALEQIASKQVQELFLQDKLPCLIASLHNVAARIAVEMKSSVQRCNYVTPTNYLEFIRIFQNIYMTKGTDLTTQKEKLSGGLKKLQQASDQVASMRVALEKKQIIITESQETCESMLKQIMVDKHRTEVQKQAVKTESEQISLEERECSIITQDAKADLTIALPALQQAFVEVDKLDKSSMTELKAYANPPTAVEKVLSCVMIFMDKPTDWASAKRSLGDINFLTDLRSYRKDNVKPAILLRVSKFVASPQFAPSEITRISKAAGALCSWCHAIYTYSNVSKDVAPKRERLSVALESLAEKQTALQNAICVLEQATAKLTHLEQKYDESVKEKNKLAQEANTLEAKLDRAEKLVNGLSSEYTRWTHTISALKDHSECLLGDVLVASAFLSYAGPFEASFRFKLIAEWTEIVKRNGIQISTEFSVKNVLSNDKDIQSWNNQGLSKDAFSTENALIITNSNRWPLIIDPQNQATKWLLNMYGDTLKVLDIKKKEYLRELETAISFGLPVLIHNVLEELDSNLDPILNKAIIKSGSKQVLRLGDKEIDYNDSFQLFIITKLGNPHYSPEILAKTTLVNFATTRIGLEEQLLAFIVTEEAPAMESKKREVTNKLFTGRNRLIELEDDILRILSKSTRNLIDDIELFKTLQDSKSLADAVNLQLKQAEETATKVDAARNVYRKAATRSSTIFFTVMSMSHIDPMYQFSLDSYLVDFQANITNSRILNGDTDPQPIAEDRVKTMMAHHSIETFKSICIALFEKDETLFALQLCCDIMLEERTLSSTDLDFICHGSNASSMIDVSKFKSSFKWMEDKVKDSLPQLEYVIPGITQTIEQDEDGWREWYQSKAPETYNLPKSRGQDMSDLHRLCILRAFRFDRFTNGVNILVRKQMGDPFTSSDSFDLLKAYKKSTSKIPLLIILSPGVDPVSKVLQVADKYSQKLVQVALGQGQGPLAIKAIEAATVSGDWVFLANCHIMPTFMDDLEAVISRLQTGHANNRFRLWLSSKPTSIFPLPILQKSVKITTEPPRGLGANMIHIYDQFDQDKFEDNGQKYGYKKLLFCIAWVHSILIERRRFKNLGFNVHYDFCDSDFDVCNDILCVMLENSDGVIPFDALRTLIGETIYGGRVTDEWDRRLLNVYMKHLFCQEAVDQHSFALSNDGEYTIPSDGPLDSYKSYINSLPTYDDPEAFGQHTNAQIASQVEATKRLLGSISFLRHDKPKQGINESNSNNTGLQSLEKLKAVPQCLDMKKVSAYEKHSLDSSAMKTFLIQEAEHYNDLLTDIHCTRKSLEDAINGKTTFTLILETQLKTISDFQVPKQWQHLYNSCKLLDSWLADLYSRVRQLELWIENGAPKAFWIGGFVNPSGFFTAVLQTEARKKCVSIDSFTWSFKVLNVKENNLDVPIEGVYVSGLLLEGASYDTISDCLLDPKPMELLCKMPIIHFFPTEAPKKVLCEQYVCPMYICPDRAGSNRLPSYFFSLKLNAGEKSTDHWVKRGVAMLLSCSD